MLGDSRLNFGSESGFDDELPTYIQQFASVSEHASLGGRPLWSDVNMTAV